MEIGRRVKSHKTSPHAAMLHTSDALFQSRICQHVENLAPDFRTTIAICHSDRLDGELIKNAFGLIYEY